eukprot:jgi/Galph1/800/GphlegSOOS_G5458.1
MVTGLCVVSPISAFVAVQSGVSIGKYRFQGDFKTQKRSNFVTRNWKPLRRVFPDSSIRHSHSLLMTTTEVNRPIIGYDKQGYLYCEDLRVADIQKQVSSSPFFLYSKAQLLRNFEAYQQATVGLDAIIGYAVKANNNLHLLRILSSKGSGVVLVSGGELKLAEKAGFDLHKAVFNGNGKTMDELCLALSKECLVNIDSEFDLEHIIEASSKVSKRARVLIRINPDIDPQVHPYISTGLANSKFGIRNTHLSWFLDRIKANEDKLELVGVHCHLGSTIRQVKIFKDAADIMLNFIHMIRDAGFHSLKYLNIGGGLGIDYEHKAESIPTPVELVSCIRQQVREAKLTLIIEPGRSVVGNTGMLICRVIGVKSNGNKEFIVVDGSMAEVIRPSLYDAFHWIGLVSPNSQSPGKFDIVGPICESADFLGKDRFLPQPKEGGGLVVMDTGAYCYSMASNYNMRPKPAEILVDRDQWTVIRRAENLMTC